VVDDKHLTRIYEQKELRRRYIAGERNFSGVAMKDFNLPNFFLVDINLSRANLEDAALQGALLIHANLSHVNLEKARLSSALLIKANLSHANLRNATLVNADLTGADLTSGGDKPPRTVRGKAFRGSQRSKNFRLIDKIISIVKKYPVVIKKKGLINTTRP
jgi:uncharacterized protein YjbI with pentapeptide repeats